MWSPRLRDKVSWGTRLAGAQGWLAAALAGNPSGVVAPLTACHLPAGLPACRLPVSHAAGHQGRGTGRCCLNACKLTTTLFLLLLFAACLYRMLQGTKTEAQAVVDAASASMPSEPDVKVEVSHTTASTHGSVPVHVRVPVDSSVPAEPGVAVEVRVGHSGRQSGGQAGSRQAVGP